MEQQLESNYEVKELIISVGSTVLSNKLTQKNFNEVIEVIRSSEKARQAIEDIRSVSYKKQRQELKKQLNYFNMGLFKNNTRKNTNLITTKHLLFDYDDLTEEQVKEKTEALKKDKTVFAVFVSPSGNGLKVIYQLDKEITDHVLFSKIYKYYAKKLGVDLGTQPDKTSDASRPCFLSYDPDIYVNNDSEPLSTDIKFDKVKESSKRNHLIKNIKGVAEGSRNSSAASLAGTLKSKGIDKEFVVSLLIPWNDKNDPPLDEKELKTVIDSIYKYEDQRVKSSEIRERNNCYYRDKQWRRLTSFILEPKELLVLSDRDCLKCNVATQQNNVYEDVLIDNTDWHSKQRFLRALGHSDCVFLGSDNELQLLCDYVISKVKVKKEGTKIIGLVNKSIWAVKSVNIDKNGIMENPLVIPYEKGKDAFYNKIKYGTLNEAEHSELIKGF